MNLLVVKLRMLVSCFSRILDLRHLAWFEQSQDRSLLGGRQNRQYVGRLPRGHLTDELGDPLFAEREHDVALHRRINLFQRVGGAFGIETLKNLYERLLKPIPEIYNADRILVAPDGILHLLPFEALQDNRGQYLLKSHY